MRATERRVLDAATQGFREQLADESALLATIPTDKSVMLYQGGPDRYLAPVALGTNQLAARLSGDIVAVDLSAMGGYHTHAASAIVSGLLALARGGLNADGSAFAASQLLRMNAGQTAIEASGKTIADFAAATHNHESAGGGGQLNASSVFSAGTVPDARIATKYRQWAVPFHLSDPQAGDEYITGVYAANASTIKRVTHRIYAGTNVVFNIKIVPVTDPEATGTNVWTSNKTSTSTSSAETSFNNDAVAQYYKLVIVVVSVSGAVTDFYGDIVMEIG